MTGHMTGHIISYIFKLVNTRFASIGGFHHQQLTPPPDRQREIKAVDLQRALQVGQGELGESRVQKRWICIYPPVNLVL
jgi:hypothetical protein